MQHPICIFGEVLFVCFPDGREMLGGAPFSVAQHLQAFGQSPVFISSVDGDEEGRHIRDAMSAWGMRLEGLQFDRGHPTGRVTVTSERSEPSYEIVADCAYDFIAPEAVPTVYPGLIYHGSLALRHPGSEAALRALKSEANVRIFVDVNLRPPWWNCERVLNLLRGADWVKLNRNELSLLGNGVGDDLAAAEVFRDTYGLEYLVVTLSGAGAVAVAVAADHDPVRVTPQSETRAVDAVGAGDAFASVLVLGLQRDWPLVTTMERAQAFASELVQRRGAAVSDPAFYRSLSEQWGLTASEPLADHWRLLA